MEVPSGLLRIQAATPGSMVERPQRACPATASPTTSTAEAAAWEAR
jgi:hypothetical protein